MSDTNYNPFLQRNAPQPPLGDAIPPVVSEQTPHEQHPAPNPGEAFEDQDDADVEDYSTSVIPFHFALDGNDRFSKWFWSFASAAFVTGLLIAVSLNLLIAPQFAPQLDFGVIVLIAGVLGVVYGAIHATWRMGKVCRAIQIDYDGIKLTFGSRDQIIDPLGVDAIMALSGIDLNGEGKGFSNLRKLVLLSGVKIEKLAFEPISNARIFVALREVCLHAWAIPAEGGLLPPAEIAEHHADRAGIDSLRRLRKYYGQFVMQLTFSSLALIVGLLVGSGLFFMSVGVKGIPRGVGRLVIFAGGLIIAALSSLRRIPREMAILRKIKETEKSLAVALGIEFGR